MKRFVRTMVLGSLALVGALVGDVRSTRADLLTNLSRASDAITTMDFDEAHRELDGADSNEPAVAFNQGRLALHELRCDEAAATFARPDLAHLDGTPALADFARGCARVMAATVMERDDARGIEIHFQDEDDRALAPILEETLEAARASLERDLGVTWPRPTRVLVVRDLLSLAAVTGLPYESAKTTGTVAVAKFGRITLLSPRASRHGYAWRDTIAHELTHLSVTRLTVDRAPLWLQEGIAKREEIRWRAPGPFDDRPSPEAIALRGIAQHLDTPLDHLGPSIAMLPSADRAAVAFAEVTSFVRFYADHQGTRALPDLLGAIRARDDANVALKELTTFDLAAWDGKWRAWLSSLPAEPLPTSWALGGAPPPGMREMRDHVRLADLLLARNHAADALVDLDLVPTDKWGSDASLRHLRARALEMSGSAAAAEATLGEPKDVGGSYGPWWATRGRFARAGGASDADEFFREGVAQDPLQPECACESLDAAFFPASPAGRGLCEAARARNEPEFGGD